MNVTRHGTVLFEFRDCFKTAPVVFRRAVRCPFEIVSFGREDKGLLCRFYGHQKIHPILHSRINVGITIILIRNGHNAVAPDKIGNVGIHFVASGCVDYVSGDVDFSKHGN